MKGNKISPCKKKESNDEQNSNRRISGDRFVCCVERDDARGNRSRLILITLVTLLVPYV